MPFRSAVTNLSRFVVIIGLCSVFAFAREEPSTGIAKSFPADLGSFHRVGAVNEEFPGHEFIRDDVPPTDFASLRLLVSGFASYRSESGETIPVSILKFEDESAAYCRFTDHRRYLRQLGFLKTSELSKIGTASLVSANDVTFLHGSLLISFSSQDSNRAAELARLFASTLEPSEGEIPVLVKHLPQWETAEKEADYSINLKTLKDVIKNQPVLEVITFEAGAEAVAANYGSSQLAIVEFTTPQISIDNDSRIWTKIAELKSQGQPVPNAYRRVGNYSVFVFNAPDDRTANALVEQVKYEQVVQWLGDDPHLAQRLQKYFTQTSAGVLVAVLKSSGLSLVLCLGIGGVIGALLFRHRRAQRSAAFSDAGGSIRLNLDELTGPASKRRLLSAAENQREDRSI